MRLRRQQTTAHIRSAAILRREFAKLKGLQIGPGWMRRVRAQVGGVHGCTHLVELLQTLAPVAFQTLSFRNRKEKPTAVDTEWTQPPHINTCHTLRSDGPIVEQEWSEFYTGS